MLHWFYDDFAVYLTGQTFCDIFSSCFIVRANTTKGSGLSSESPPITYMYIVDITMALAIYGDVLCNALTQAPKQIYNS